MESKAYRDPTLDELFTYQCSDLFHTACKQKLVNAASGGRGYWVEASEDTLISLLHQAADDEDWESVANYAMMLRMNQRMALEYARHHGI